MNIYSRITNALVSIAVLSSPVIATETTSERAVSIVNDTVKTIVKRAVKPAITGKIIQNFSKNTGKVAGSVLGGGAIGFGFGIFISPTMLGDATVKHLRPKPEIYQPKLPSLPDTGFMLPPLPLNNSIIEPKL